MVLGLKMHLLIVNLVWAHFRYANEMTRIQLFLAFPIASEFEFRWPQIPTIWFLTAKIFATIHDCSSKVINTATFTTILLSGIIQKRKFILHEMNKVSKWL